jgi:hypothetical protein
VLSIMHMQSCAAQLQSAGLTPSSQAGSSNAYCMRFVTFTVFMVRRSTGSAVAHDQAPPRIVPIASLNHYQSRWTIKARVTQKGAKRAYSNARGDGKVFSTYSYRP